MTKPKPKPIPSAPIKPAEEFIPIRGSKLLALADYFSGPTVGAMSVSLEIKGLPQNRAKAFFKAREALGITGWATADEAFLAMLK